MVRTKVPRKLGFRTTWGGGFACRAARAEGREKRMFREPGDGKKCIFSTNDSHFDPAFLLSFHTKGQLRPGEEKGST